MKPVSMFFLVFFVFLVPFFSWTLAGFVFMLYFTSTCVCLLHVQVRPGDHIQTSETIFLFLFFFLHLNHCSQFSLSYCTYCSCTMYATKWQGYVGCHTFCSDLFHKVANRTASVKLEVVANKNNNAAYQTRRHTAIKWISWKYDPVTVNDD